MLVMPKSKKKQNHKSSHCPSILYTVFDRCHNSTWVSRNSLTLSNIKYQVWNTGLYVLNKIRAGATCLSVLHPNTAKAETARAGTPTRAATSQSKERTGATSPGKGRTGREEGQNAAPVTTMVEE